MFLGLCFPRLEVSMRASRRSGGLVGLFLLAAGPASAQLVISEFRVRGPSGANDEFVEIMNNSGADHTVAGGGTGYALLASDGVTRCVIPNGTVIPANGRYLCVNSVAYSLASYPAGNGTTATGNATFTTDIPDNAGVALFNTSVAANFNLANRIDAVGSTSEANTLYKEGTGYPAIVPFSIDHAFARDECGKLGSITTTGPCPSGGVVVDTNNNAANFYFVDTNGTSAGAGQRLGAPGPQNLSSPRTGTASMPAALLDSCVDVASAPNRVRDFTSDPPNNSTFGTLDLRATYTNNTGVSLTRLRFRIIDLTTFPAPSGVSDLRPRTSTDVVVTVDRPPCGSGTSNVTANGTTLEQPPSQPNGGGFNSTLSVNDVTLATPLANGASIDVRFLFGIQQTGSFRVGLLAETLPVGASTLLELSGCTDGCPADLSVTKTDGVTSATPGGSVTYTITASNAGPNPVTGATVTDTFPAALTCTWTCVGAGGGTCTAAGSGNISNLVTLPASASATYTASCTIAPSATGSLVNTATVSVPAGVTDPTPANNSATDTDTLEPIITPIHDVQGNGASSPIAGSIVTIRGIVTGVKSNGFFVQEEDADHDADPATSEGIFVFTSAAPPAAAAFSAQVQVTGTVAEFVPSDDPLQPPVTQLTFPTVVQLATGQPLPTAMSLSTTFPDPAGPFDQLERLEHMRVSASSITVTGPSQGTVNEPTATGTSNGRFFGVLTGVGRPFREAGVQAPDPVPSGSIPPIPRWDFNPERIRIESAGLIGQPVLTVRSGQVVTEPIVGPLDYASRSYGLHPDGTTTLVVTTPGTLVTTVAIPAANEVTVASINLRRFFDTVDDPGIGEPILTAAAFDRRLSKASMAIRDHLRSPDIIGVQEVESLSMLQVLAARIASDAIAAGGEAEYVAYLVEGNDVEGLDVGFLVKANLVTGGVPRVSVSSVTQVGASTTWIDPSTGASALLNDRPPLVLEATVHNTPTASFPIVAIVNDLLGPMDIASDAPDGLTTVGDRVRRKRQAQAEFLANYLQGRLTANPAEHLAVIGSLNAFEVNDGYADLTNVVAGTPPPDNETVVPGDGVDLVNPDLVNLVNTPAAPERYSVVLDGNAANLDHALVSAGLIAATTARRIERPRIGADYPETELDGVTALRFSDRDPLVAHLASDALNVADLSVTKTDTPDPVIAGGNLTYTITVTNSGPDAAELAVLSDPLPGGTTFVSLSSPGGWSCTTPPVGAGGTIACSIASSAVGSAVFTLTVAIAPATAAGTVVANTATISSSTSDPNSGDNFATAATTVTTSADVSIVKIDTPDPVVAGQNLTYGITITNSGPNAAALVMLSDTLPAGTTFVSLSASVGWSCTTPPVGAGGTITCVIASLGAGSAVFTLTAATAPATAAGAVLTNTATVSSSTSDPNSGNNTATASTTVTTSADVSILKTGPASVSFGGSIVYTLTVVNAGPSSASDVTIADPTPPGLTFVSTTGACVSTFPCALGTLAAGESRVVTATFKVPAGYAGANPIVNTATVSTTAADTVLTNNTASASTLVNTAGPTACDVDGDGSPDFITGPGPGGGPHLRIWSLAGGSVTERFGAGFFAYDPTLIGGVSVACRDLNGDGIGEIVTGAGPGGDAHVRVFSVAGGIVWELAGFNAYPGHPGGVTVAAGDLTGDGIAEIITGAGPGGGPHVRVWSVAGGSLSEIAGFFAYNPAHTGGVAVAAGDVTGDGVAEIITGAGPGGGPHVRVWSLAGGGVFELTGFFAYDPAFGGGVALAAADITGDGVAELITGAGPSGGPHVRVWSLIGGTIPVEIAGFFAYDPAFAGGVSVAAGDVTGDGLAELITGAGPGGVSHVRVWSLTAGLVEIAGFVAYDPAFGGGVRVGR